MKYSGKQIVAWSLATVIISLGFLLGTMKIVNPIRPVYCCGDMPTNYWGWIYSWLKCYSINYCGVANAEVSIVEMIINLIFFANLAQIVFGLASTFKNLVGKLLKIHPQNP